MRAFFLRTTKTDGTAPLYLRIQRRTPALNIQINTGIDVDVKKWNTAGGDFAAYSKMMGKGAERMAQDVDRAVDDSLSKGQDSKEDIQEAIDAVVHREVREAIARQQEFDEREAARKAEQERINRARENADIRGYIDQLIKGMNDGSVRIEGKGRNQGGRYTKNTIKMWGNLRGIVYKFYNIEPFTWDSIDQRFATRFRAWMEDEGYMPKSVNKYVGQFVALINRAYTEGRHTNATAANLFRRPMVDDSQKAAEIYLTSDELNALYQMPLTGEEALVRDVFIIGCCTCQRVSDYSRLRKENFVTTARGTKVVKIQQRKTRTMVTIPVLDSKLTDIMERYDYCLTQLPATFDQILNRYIKSICKKLSKTMPSLAEEIPTQLTMKERELENAGKLTFKRDKYGRVVKPRYDLVTSHTARRTGITHLYLSGKFDVYQMMHVSGHKEAKTFKEYIRLSGEEMAEQISLKMGNDNLF